MPEVLNSRKRSLHLLGESSDSWDCSQSLRIFYVVIDVCAKAVVLDAPKGGTDSSRSEKSNPIKFLHHRGHAGEEEKNLSGFGRKSVSDCMDWIRCWGCERQQGQSRDLISLL